MSHAEAEAIYHHTCMNEKGWNCFYERDRWVLCPPAEFIARFRLAAGYQIGRYDTLAEAYAAWSAVTNIDWLSQLRRTAPPAENGEG